MIVGETRPASRRLGDKTNVFLWAGLARRIKRVSGGSFVVLSSSCRRRVVVVSSSSCRRRVVVMSSSCRRRVVVVSLSCRRRVVIVSSSCRRCVVVVSSSCRHRRCMALDAFWWQVVGWLSTRPASQWRGDKTNVFSWAGPARRVERVSGGSFFVVLAVVC